MNYRDIIVAELYRHKCTAPAEAIDIAVEGCELEAEDHGEEYMRGFVNGMAVLLMNLDSADSDGAFLFREVG